MTTTTTMMMTWHQMRGTSLPAATLLSSSTSCEVSHASCLSRTHKTRCPPPALTPPIIRHNRIQGRAGPPWPAYETLLVPCLHNTPAAAKPTPSNKALQTLRHVTCPDCSTLRHVTCPDWTARVFSLFSRVGALLSFVSSHSVVKVAVCVCACARARVCVGRTCVALSRRWIKTMCAPELFLLCP